MPKINLSQARAKIGAGYPKQFLQANGDISKREVQSVSDGLSAFGASRVLLPPGAASSLRHYHLREDELVIVLSGELVMLTNAGETVMRAGDIAAFPMGVEDAHAFVNRSSETAVLIAVGNNSTEDQWFYPDVGMMGDHVLGYVSTSTGKPF